MEGKNEVYIETSRGFHGLRVDIDESRIQTFEDEDIDITLLTLQYESAFEHYKIMKSLFPPLFWLFY